MSITKIMLVGHLSLMSAAVYHKWDVVRELLKHENINVNVRDEGGSTAISEAVCYGN